MTLNGRNALLAKVNKNSGAHQKKIQGKIDLYSMSAEKCRPGDLFSRNIKYMRMFAGVPLERGVM